MDLVNELQNLDPKEIGLASLPIRIGAIVLACAALIGGSVYYFWKPKFEELERHKKTEATLKQDFLAKARKAANLQEYKDQVARVEVLLATLKKQLPKEAEIPALIVDISQTALASGLEIQRFEPGRETKQDLGYVKQPIVLRMTGEYEEFGAFVSGVAALPRIVTIENVTLKPVADSKQGKERGVGQTGVTLAMDAIAATYRYSEGGG